MMGGRGGGGLPPGPPCTAPPPWCVGGHSLMGGGPGAQPQAGPEHNILVNKQIMFVNGARKEEQKLVLCHSVNWRYLY